MKTICILLLMLVLTACSRNPEPIAYGKESCEHCKMTIIDIKYGAEIVTSKGKLYKFDATECMAKFIKENGDKVNKPADLLLTIDLAKPETLIDARTAYYLNDNAYKSPMGANIAAFSSKQLAENNVQTPDAKILTWNQLLKSF